MSMRNYFYPLNPLIITFTGLYEIPKIIALNHIPYAINFHHTSMSEPKMYLPAIVKSAIHAIMPKAYFREKMSGAL